MKDQTNTTIEKRKESLRNEFMLLEASDHVVVIGGGPTGIETAEICARFPKKIVTLIHAHNALLNNHPTSVQREVEHFFSKYPNVDLKLNTRVTDCVYKKDKYVLTVKDGSKVKADKVYTCGGFIPNTEFMNANFSHVLSSQNTIAVEENLLVKGTTNIWALGDATDVGMIKTAYAAVEQAKFLSHQLPRVLKSKSVESYKRAIPPVGCFSLGVERFGIDEAMDQRKVANAKQRYRCMQESSQIGEGEYRRGCIG